MDRKFDANQNRPETHQNEGSVRDESAYRGTFDGVEANSADPVIWPVQAGTERPDVSSPQAALMVLGGGWGTEPVSASSVWPFGEGYEYDEPFIFGTP